MPTLSGIIILLLFVILLTIFVGRTWELIISRLQRGSIGPIAQKNRDQESSKTVHHASP